MNSNVMLIIYIIMIILLIIIRFFQVRSKHLLKELVSLNKQKLCKKEIELTGIKQNNKSIEELIKVLGEIKNEKTNI